MAQVCNHYGIHLTSGGRVVDETKNQGQQFMQIRQNGELVLNEKIVDQITINTDAKQTIKDLFPKIPEKDLFQIIKTAFQLGQNRVGTADEIPLVRRAQLAVVAHIRHIYTNYDKLLRELPYNDARHQVERDTLLKLVEWRGDEQEDEASRRAVDDIVREVVYISDDDESGSDVEEIERIDQEHIRVEELPRQAYADDQRAGLPLRLRPNYEIPEGSYAAPQVARRYSPDEEQLALRDRHRYKVWDSIRADYRNNLAKGSPRLSVEVPLNTELPPVGYEVSHPLYLRPKSAWFCCI